MKSGPEHWVLSTDIVKDVLFRAHRGEDVYDLMMWLYDQHKPARMRLLPTEMSE